jgi:hypothetical protein
LKNKTFFVEMFDKGFKLVQCVSHEELDERCVVCLLARKLAAIVGSGQVEDY